MGLSPGAIAFERDMIHNIPLNIDFPALRAKRQAKINENLLRANKKRINHNYQPNDEVQIIENDHQKLDEKAHGPYQVTRAFTNGTVELEKENNVRQLLNIRWIRPHYRHNTTHFVSGVGVSSQVEKRATSYVCTRLFLARNVPS